MIVCLVCSVNFSTKREIIQTHKKKLKVQSSLLRKLITKGHFPSTRTFPVVLGILKMGRTLLKIPYNFIGID